MPCNAADCIFRRNGYCTIKPDLQPTNVVGLMGPMFECRSIKSGR